MTEAEKRYKALANAASGRATRLAAIAEELAYTLRCVTLAYHVKVKHEGEVWEEIEAAETLLMQFDSLDLRKGRIDQGPVRLTLWDAARSLEWVGTGLTAEQAFEAVKDQAVSLPQQAKFAFNVATVRFGKSGFAHARRAGITVRIERGGGPE